MGMEHTHTHPFNGPFSRTTRVSQYQKEKTNLDFTEARDSEWQWHQLGHMQVCISLQTDNHASTPPFKIFTGRMPFLPPNRVKALKAWDRHVKIKQTQTKSIPNQLLDLCKCPRTVAPGHNNTAVACLQLELMTTHGTTDVIDINHCTEPGNAQQLQRSSRHETTSHTLTILGQLYLSA